MHSDRKKISCINQAYKLLALRSHSVFELGAKLKIRDYDPGEIDAALARLHELGYLDDTKYSKAYALMRVKKMRLGPKRIRIDLLRKGFRDDLISKTVLEIFGDDGNELKTAILAAKKKLRLFKKNLDTEVMKRKLYDHLQRRGFTADVSRRIALDNFDEILDK